jgi:acid phosphatase class B
MTDKQYEKDLADMQLNYGLSDKDIEVIRDICKGNLDFLRSLNNIFMPKPNKFISK